MKRSEKAESQPTSRPWPAEKVEQWDLERLFPAPANPRTHAKADIDQLAKLIERYGWTMPVLCDETGTIIAGEARTLAARQLELKTVPVIVARSWTEQEKRSYRIADNQLTLRSSWDLELLGIEMDWLKAEGFNLDLTGFDPAELEAILKTARSGGLTDPDATPEVPDEAISRLGDIWIMDNHRAACGDSTAKGTVAQLLGDSAPLLMVTDPPYGVAYDPSWREGQDLGVGKAQREKC
jgi:ParB-like chromosome segregation protein Spo0J